MGYQRFVPTTLEIGLASQRNSRGRIPQKCCGDCWGDCRGKSECRRECCGVVPGDLPRDCRGDCRETALSCDDQRRAVFRHSTRQSLGRSSGTTPQHSPRHSDFPGSPPSSLRSTFGEFGLGSSSGWPAQSQHYPNLLFLAFLVFLAFFLFKEFLAILSVLPFFPKVFRGLVSRRTPCLFGGFPCCFPKRQRRLG